MAPTNTTIVLDSTKHSGILCPGRKYLRQRKSKAAHLKGIRTRRDDGVAIHLRLHDEQVTGYEDQIDCYTQYIKKRDDWEFVKVYMDEGISGTKTKRREGFNEMVADALAGIIDLMTSTA